ncbi:MAG: sigma-70 family RNA polymerase sigma factor [Nitrosomonas sp.]
MLEMEYPANNQDHSADEVRLQSYVLAIGQHDEQALESLYESTLSRVYGLALRITRNKQAAEEVTEDVYWQVWRTARCFNAQRGTVMAWLLIIARSRALDYLRQEDAAEICEAPELLILEPICVGDPQDLLIATQRKTQLNQALLQLDPIQRQLIALAFFRGLTHEEITAYTGIALGTVKSHIRRGLKYLQDILVKYSVENTSS